MSNWKKALAKNLKEIRKEKGYTQLQLARLLNYSEKTIAKWENSVSVPSMDALARVSEILGVSFDRLFRLEEDAYFLGIDGGGTKTALALADKDGKTVRALKTESTNPFVVGLDRAKATLEKAIYEICKGVSLSNVFLFAGLAGGNEDPNKKAFHDFFEKFRFAAFANDGDSANIIALGLRGDDGVTMIAGTGICVYQVYKGKKKRLAGWGNLFDEGGSGYAIGRDVISAYFQAYDGSGEQTLLTKLVEEETKLPPQAFLNKAYAEDKNYVAYFSRVAFSAAKQGDLVAEKIIEKNVKFAAKVVTAAAKPFGEGRVRLVLTGGLATQEEYKKRLQDALPHAEKFDVVALLDEPVFGAVKLAIGLKGEN
ncbi:MAG: XRE family transcriptional regulator [Clostridia bacterium]|nr:XRE family transcriptional regulator [Clostridia bacterium]